MVESPKTFFNGQPEHVISMPIKNGKLSSKNCSKIPAIPLALKPNLL
jgi:hypothetical protein